LLTPDERLERRRREAVPILHSLRQWLTEQRARTDVKKRSRSPSGRALTYLHNQWDRLALFAERGDIDIHNNRSELLLRNPVTGRKNWLFAGSPDGAVANAVHPSIMASCMLAGIDPSAYLHDVLPKLSGMTPSEVAVITPPRWAESQRASRMDADL
jgi:transposase